MKFRILTAVTAVMLLTGCSSEGMVSEKSYLRAAAFEDGHITLSFFSEDDQNITINSTDPQEVRKSAELTAGKEVFTGYTELILLGRDSSPEVLEILLNEWKVSPECIVARPVGSGEKLLEKRTAEQLEGAVRTAQKQELADKCDIVTVMGHLLSGKHTAEVPKLSENGFCGTETISGH